MNPKSINEIVRTLLDALPEGVKQLPEEAQQHLQAAIVATLNRLDVVTREEFEAQKKVLERTRQKLEQLEQLLQEREG
jgi:BMFP domain-containing protein YqiC